MKFLFMCNFLYIKIENSLELFFICSFEQGREMIFS